MRSYFIHLLVLNVFRVGRQCVCYPHLIRYCSIPAQFVICVIHLIERLSRVDREVTLVMPVIVRLDQPVF